MVPFVSFLGSSVLTSSVIYLGLLQLQNSTRETQRTLRQCSKRLDALRSPGIIIKNPGQHSGRPSVAETLKDSWNEQIMKLARCAQRLDWVWVRETIEDGVGSIVEKARR